MVQEYTSNAYLVIQQGNSLGKRIELWKDCTTIGRTRECDIFLEDITVHRKQARIVRTREGYILYDEGKGDSFVNGNAVSEQVLNSSDRLTFGNTQVTFFANEGTRPFQLPSSRGRELLAGKRPDAHGIIIARFEFMDNRSGIQSIEIFPDMTIGRSRECDVFLEDLAVSRVHARISELPNGQYELLDNRSATGTYINGQPLERCVLHEGDQIQIGSSHFTYRSPGAKR